MVANVLDVIPGGCVGAKCALRGCINRVLLRRSVGRCTYRLTHCRARPSLTYVPACTVDRSYNHSKPSADHTTRPLCHSWLAPVLAAALYLHASPALSIPSVEQCTTPCPSTATETWISKYVDPQADQGVRPAIPSTFPALPELQLPKYQKVRLSNGLKVFLLEDHEVPLVRGTILVRGGKYASPSDRVGVASLTAMVQRSGGSVAHPGSVLDERLEELAARIEAGAGPQAVSVDFSCMQEDVSEVLGLFSEVVRSPGFPPEKLALAKTSVRNALEHQYDSPAAVSQSKLLQLLYGEDSIYARRVSRAQLDVIQREDLQQYAAKWERPDAAVLGIVGDFNTPDMLALVGQYFGSWAPAEGQPPTPFPPPHADLPAQTGAGTIFLVDRPGSTQASVSMGEPGVVLGSKDSFSLDVLGGIFNSFGGRLFDQIRSREGLTYSVSGGWDSPPDHQGIFQAGGSTSSPAAFVSALQRVLATATQEPPSDSEIQEAKSETINSFVFNFSSTAAQLQRTLIYDLLGLPQDFLFTYKRSIEAVTAEDVLKAAQEHLHPEQQTVVVAADAATVGPAMKAAGFAVEPLPLGEV